MSGLNSSNCGWSTTSLRVAWYSSEKIVLASLTTLGSAWILSYDSMPSVRYAASAACSSVTTPRAAASAPPCTAASFSLCARMAATPEGGVKALSAGGSWISRCAGLAKSSPASALPVTRASTVESASRSANPGSRTLAASSLWLSERSSSAVTPCFFSAGASSSACRRVVSCCTVLENSSWSTQPLPFRSKILNRSSSRGAFQSVESLRASASALKSSKVTPSVPGTAWGDDLMSDALPPAPSAAPCGLTRRSELKRPMSVPRLIAMRPPTHT